MSKQHPQTQTHTEKKTQAVNATASEGHRKRHHPQSKQTKNHSQNFC